jgi:hypothetical protein
MPRYSAQVDYNPQTGIEKKFHRLHDGGWAYETIQHTTHDILDFNKERQNHYSATSQVNGDRLVASIPLIFVQKWLDDYGIDYWNPDPDMQKRVDRLLDDPEWKWLRTDNSTLSNNVASKAQIESRISARKLLEAD